MTFEYTPRHGPLANRTLDVTAAEDGWIEKVEIYGCEVEFGEWERYADEMEEHARYLISE